MLQKIIGADEISSAPSSCFFLSLRARHFLPGE
jgi:hypothetical protein